MLKMLFEEYRFELLVLDFAVFYNLYNGIFIVTFVGDCLFIIFKFSEINVVKRKIIKKHVIKDRGFVVYILRV